MNPLKCSLLLCLTLSFGVQASVLKIQTPSSFYDQVSKEAPFDVANENYTWTNAQDVESGKAHFKGKARNPSSSLSGNESMMSETYKTYRDRFLTIKTAEELDQYLKDMDDNYERITDLDAKYFAAQLIPLRSMRGIVWRCIPVLSKTKTTHSVILTAVKSMASNMKIFLPTEQWDAGFDYVTRPYVHNGVVLKQFANEAQLLAHFSGTVRNSLLTLARRLNTIKFGDNYVVWDNKLLFGKASFVDDLDRYRLIGDIERLSTLATVHGVLAQLSYQRAYSSENAVKIWHEMGKLYGMDGFLSDVDGAPSSKRTDVLKKSKYASYGVLFKDGKDWMRASLNHLRESVRLTAMIWDEIKKEDRPMTEAFLFDTSFARPYQRGSDLAVMNMLAMVEGKTQIRSNITGEVVTVDLPAFYENPPSDLKKLLPNGFQGGEQWKKLTLTDGQGKKHDVNYRDYFVGRATSWDTQAYKTFLPDIGSAADIPKSVRILSQSWGTWIAAIPISDVVE